MSERSCFCVSGVASLAPATQKHDRSDTQNHVQNAQAARIADDRKPKIHKRVSENVSFPSHKHSVPCFAIKKPTIPLKSSQIFFSEFSNNPVFCSNKTRFDIFFDDKNDILCFDKLFERRDNSNISDEKNFFGCLPFWWIGGEEEDFVIFLENDSRMSDFPV